MKLPTAVRSIAMLFLSLASPLHAQAPLLDPNLPSVKPQALQHLSDNRVRQRIMQESQALRWQVRVPISDERPERSLVQGPARGHHNATSADLLSQPSHRAMVSDWRRHHWLRNEAKLIFQSVLLLL